MKTTLSLVLVASGVLALADSHAIAQAPPRQFGGPAPQQSLPPQARPRSTGVPAGPSMTGPVAIVDIGYIYKTHPAFQQVMEMMKKEVEAEENKLRQEHQAIAKKSEILAQYNQGSNEYKNTEREIAESRAKLQASAQLTRDDLLQREAKEYFAFYDRVQKAVAAVAHHRGVSVVFRFNRDEMDPNDRASVLQGVNRPVVHFDPQLDITDEVLRVMGMQPPAQTARAIQPGQPGQPLRRN